MFDWRQWCRICGNVKANKETQLDLLQVVGEVFQIETSNAIHICWDCHTYIQNLQRFLQNAMFVKEMFLDIEQKDETETVDEELALQMRLHYGLSIPNNSDKYEMLEDTDMLDDFAEIENFIIEDDSVDQENIKTEYILKDGEFDDELTQGSTTDELIRYETGENVNEEIVEVLDEIIYEELQDENKDEADSSANEISENNDPLEKQVRAEEVTDDMSRHFEFRCHECEETFNKMHFLTIHTKTVHDCSPKVVCPCGKFIGSTKALQSHYKNHVRNIANFECFQCHKNYKTETHYTNHMITHHGNGSKAEFVRLYVCDCGKSFKNARHLTVHANSHLPDDQKFIHPCSHCGKRYSSIFSLRQHVKHVHIKSPILKCPKCEKRFSRKANLESHINHVHTTERNFECDICGLKVKTKGILRMHKKIHSTNPEDFLTCEVCQRQFKTQNQLINHKISHISEKKYKCTLCLAQYKRPKELTSHIASSHTGETKYSCHWCSKSFHNNSNYRKHKLKMHPEEVQSHEIKTKLVDEIGFNFE